MQICDEIIVRWEVVYDFFINEQRYAYEKQNNPDFNTFCSKTKENFEPLHWINGTIRIEDILNLKIPDGAKIWLYNIINKINSDRVAPDFFPETYLDLYNLKLGETFWEICQYTKSNLKYHVQSLCINREMKDFTVIIRGDIIEDGNHRLVALIVDGHIDTNIDIYYGS